MATLKRDNGIIAIDYDLFAMARDNLEEAVSLRTDDARAQLYLGKVISLTARNEDDRRLAEEHFMKAIQYDETARRLSRSASGTRPPPDRRTTATKPKFATRSNLTSLSISGNMADSLPNNMLILYDYLNLVGEPNWYAAPAEVISTRNVEPIRTNATGPATALTGPEVIAVATSTNTPQPSADTQLAAAPVPAAKSKASAKKTAAK